MVKSTQEKRIKCSEYEFPFIPDDILYEIFRRLPVKSLLRFRCISKTWSNAIDGLSFANWKLSTRAAFADEDNQILYLPVVRKPPYPLQLLTLHDGNVVEGFEYPVLEFPNNIYESNLIRYTAYGLFCFHTRGDVGRAYLCNPCRGEVLELPESEAGVLYGMGFDSTTNTYKIVRVSQRTEIYTLGTQSWRGISSVPSCSSLHELSNGVSAYGDMHWVDDDFGYLKKVEKCMIITSFDFKKEEFKQTPLPDFGHKSSDVRFKMINLRGCLSFVILSLEIIEIWMLKDYEKKEWVKEYNINHSCEHLMKELCLFVNAWGHGIIFHAYCSTKSPAVFFDLRTNRLLNLQLPERKDFNKTIYSYTGSILSLKHFGNLVVAAEDRRCNFLKTARLVYLKP